MGHIERLIQNYDTRVSLPWERNLAGPQRVWFAVYNKTEEWRLRKRLEEFEISTGRAGHGWTIIDLTDSFARWLATCDENHRLGYFSAPGHLEGDHRLWTISKMIESAVLQGLKHFFSRIQDNQPKG
jgi:hypothetical protein